MSVGQTDIVGDSLSVRAKYFRVNSLIICGLFVLSMVSIPLLGFPENSIIYFFAQRFNHDVELSVPTLYNYFLILSNIGLITLVYLSERSMRTSQAPYWLFLAVVMFLMSYDEAARVHERLMDPMRTIVPDTPLLNFPWTPVGIVVALAVATICIPFLRRLPREVAGLMIVAGAVFVFGAVVVETIGGWVAYYYDRAHQFFILATIEESCEMLGMVVFGYAMLLHIARMRPSLRLPLT